MGDSYANLANRSWEGGVEAHGVSLRSVANLFLG